MAAKTIVTISKEISNPDVWRKACEDLSFTALGVLAWILNDATTYPDDSITLEVLDPNLEPGVEPAVYELATAGYVTLTEVES